MNHVSNWKFIKDSVRLYFFLYRPLNPRSNTIANALNRLQFFTGCCYDGLHTSKCIQQSGRSLATDTWQALQAWEECLGELASLAALNVSLTRAQALRELTGIVHERVFQPEGETAPVQVMGLLECISSFAISGGSMIAPSLTGSPQTLPACSVKTCPLSVIR